MPRIQGETSSRQLATHQVYVGVDASKSYLDVYFHPCGIARRVRNDKTGIAALVRVLRPHTPETVVLMQLVDITGFVKDISTKPVSAWPP